MATSLAALAGLCLVAAFVAAAAHRLASSACPGDVRHRQDEGPGSLVSRRTRPSFSGAGISLRSAASSAAVADLGRGAALEGLPPLSICSQAVARGVLRSLNSLRRSGH
ncbi:uncharacterized protein PSFLO_01233 [Pseudozyma flocculosa]|uniref:Uncharacterized protein n=1 Tax=Pseudozyma flocculosa TaxID=84751 RepID=A0A5C3EUQ3_9BASI|nr:uncharacterized protein PSFLO_01233 [Pseudozyma flocculosa]